jgi:hypothetical protein
LDGFRVYISIFNTESSKVGRISVLDTIEVVELTDDDYNTYFRDWFGVNPDEDVRKRIQSDATLQMKLTTYVAMKEKRDELYQTFPYYNSILSCGRFLWVTFQHQDRSKQIVLKLDEYGSLIASGTLPSSVDIKH